MPKERIDKSINAEIVFYILFTFLLPGLFFLLMLNDFDSPMKPWQRVIGFAGPIAILTVPCFLILNIFYRYRCPECKTHLPLRKTKARSNFEYRFYCQKCNIIWKTGVHDVDAT
jgi:hypothetical protein